MYTDQFKPDHDDHCGHSYMTVTVADRKGTLFDPIIY